MNDTIYDVLIIGAGPAGLTAAIYASRANLSVLIIEAEVFGGKLSKTYEIENYPGIRKISGMELAMQLSEHGQAFGAKLITGSVDSISDEDGLKKISITNGDSYLGKTVIVATGTKERELDVPGAKEYTGRGVSYCAVCDGFFYRNKKVAIIGGGNSAVEEALYLATLAQKVTVIIRRDVFRADALAVDRLKKNEKIDIVYRHVPDHLKIDEGKISGLFVRSVDDGQLKLVECDGVFPYIGADPCTSFLDPALLDENGYIKVDEEMKTAAKGIWAAGDCIAKDLRQVVTACNDGAIAANSISRFLKI